MLSSVAFPGSGPAVPERLVAVAGGTTAGVLGEGTSGPGVRIILDRGDVGENSLAPTPAPALADAAGLLGLVHTDPGSDPEPFDRALTRSTCIGSAWVPVPCRARGGNSDVLGDEVVPPCEIWYGTLLAAQSGR